MAVEHREAVTHAVYALEQHPTTRARTLERLAQGLDFGLRHALARLEVSLNDAMATPGRVAVTAGREGARDVGRATVGLDADAVRILVGMLGDVGVGRGKCIEHRDGVRHTVSHQTSREQLAVDRKSVV